MSDEVITRVDADGNVTAMRNRPDAHNALDPAMTRLLTASLTKLDAAEAWRIGLVHEIVGKDALNGTVGVMLAQLYSGSPRAMAAAKNLIPLSAHASIDKKILNETSRRIAAIRATAEGQEGLSAFLEKCKPKWVEPTNVSGKRNLGRRITQMNAEYVPRFDLRSSA